jgi:hypothetical protein
MKTLATLPLLVVLTTASVHAQAPSIPTTPPAPCRGDRFVLDASALPPDATVSGGAIADVVLEDDVTATVGIEGCPAATGIAVVKKKAVIVRARIEGCSTAPFRVRLRMRPLCDSVIGVTRQRGDVVATYAGAPSVCGDGVIDEGTGETCELDDPTCNETCDGANASTDPDPEPASPAPGVTPFLVADNAPRITGFSPASAEPGAVIIIQGQNFLRDRDGDLWDGNPPWRLFFRRVGRLPLGTPADFTVLSNTQLEVTVPQNAGTGKVHLEQAARIFVEQSSFAFSADEFEVVSAEVDPTPSPTPGGQPVLRIINNAQYDLVDLRLNGQQVIVNESLVTPPGFAIEIPFLSGGQVQIQANTGFGIGDVLFTFSVTRVVAATGTTDVGIPAVTVPQLLTNFSAARDWSTDLFVGDDGQFHVLTLRFFSNGGWAHILDGTQQLETGGVALVSWPPNGLGVTFSTRPGENVQTFFPWSSFLFRGLVYTAQ